VTRTALSVLGTAVYAQGADSAQAALSNRAGRTCSGLEHEILELFWPLPDRKAVKIWAPPTKDGCEVLVELNSDQQMFVANTMKSVILCERLRQLDSPDIETKLRKHELVLDKRGLVSRERHFQSA